VEILIVSSQYYIALAAKFLEGWQKNKRNSETNEVWKSHGPILYFMLTSQTTLILSLSNMLQMKSLPRTGAVITCYFVGLIAYLRCSYLTMKTNLLHSVQFVGKYLYRACAIVKSPHFSGDELWKTLLPCICINMASVCSIGGII
jgi:hypothetical protein